MLYHVIVSFGKEKEYEYKFSDSELAGGSAEEARRWFDKEFTDLECEPSNPMGKVLIIDKILNVARYGGEQRFVDGKDWAKQFARYTALALGRDTIRVDVAGFNIGSAGGAVLRGRAVFIFAAGAIDALESSFPLPFFAAKRLSSSFLAASPDAMIRKAFFFWHVSC